MAAVIILSGLVGPAPVAQAADAPTCDQTALDAAVKSATTNVRAAQKAYTVFTHTSMQALAKQLKAERVKKARVKAHKAHKRHHGHKNWRINRISKRHLLTAVKAERARLKAAWNAAKVELATAKSAADACRASGAGGGETTA